MMILRLAKAEERTTVLKLYKSVLGREFCAWDDEYPSMEFIDEDILNNNLYILEEKGELIGAISNATELEFQDLNCWKYYENVAELARLVIKPEYQGNKYAKFLVEEMFKILSIRGYKSVHAAIAEINLPSQKTSSKVGFEKVGKELLWDEYHYLYEKVLECENQ